ncbi:MAG: cytochrome c biogenesis protein CcsA [Bacteroidota bacterium]
MERLIRQSWWKWLGVLILIYVFIAGLLVPIKPNVPTVIYEDPELGQSFTLGVVGYNTHFQEQAGTTRAWLRLTKDGQIGPGIAMSSIEVLDDRRANLTFNLPAGIPSDREVVSLSLYVDGPKDGVYVRPGAVQVNNPAQDSTATSGWDPGGMSDLHRVDYMTFPARRILDETIRNTYFHVALWLAMMLLFIAAVVYAIKYLRRQAKTDKGQLELPMVSGLEARRQADLWSVALTEAGLLLGLLGLITGALWAKYTWGSFWSWDIKQFTTLIALLIYAGYFVLRASFQDPEQRGRIGAAYNIFAFAALIPLIYILPRIAGNSLHPGNAGNPAFGSEDLDNTMRMVFYPAVIGWTLIGGWLASLKYRTSRLETLEEENFPD